MSEKLQKIVEIVEVSPRDGIQNESKILSLDTKIELILRALQSGAKRIEVASFVHPSRVPQMANAEDVVARLPQGVARYIGLILNRRGFDRAASTNLNEVNFVVVASDTFNRRNQGADTFDTVGEWGEIAADARGRIAASVTIAAAFGCPFEGEVPLDRLLEVVDGVMRHDPAELALADTIGVATPKDVTDRIAAIRTRFPDIPLRLHLHNTRNTGIANAWAAVLAGVSALDSSFAGAGGCPFAPRATGNIATEDLVYMLDRASIDTGMKLDTCIETAVWLEQQLAHTLPGMVMKAGGFPVKSTKEETV
jgi:hydroxymethylglutaryl-CoA lyase